MVTRSIEDEVMAVRLLPAAAVFAPFQRMVRDLGHEHDKDVRLLVEGGETEIDRKILEQLRDPLMHLLRNAVDHGVEAPHERVRAGKPRTATVRLSAAQRGGQIEIVVEDDGQGIDPAHVRQRAVARGLITAEQAAVLDDAGATELIFHRGFSTRQIVTETSGRGVGMDVAREHVERLGGSVKVESTPGQGTQFVLTVPLTLATTRAVVVEQGGQVCAIPSAGVERMGRVRESDVLRLEGRRAVSIEGRAVPLVELGSVLERAPSAAHPAGVARPYLVLRQGDRRVAVLADRLVDEQEIVVKSLGWPLRRVRNVGGAAVLGSGQTAVILNATDLLKSGLKLAGTAAGISGGMADGGGPAEVAMKRLLVVDDSLTTRTLVRSILEAAGYDVSVAVDGADALRILRERSFDLVVSDVQMPNVDGFALTAEIRRDPQLRGLPVVLVTSLDAPEHREQGAAAGADAYIVKSGFDQGQLLDTVGRLL
jgi:two-component system chemotaxis sensor kinase CheA